MIRKSAAIKISIEYMDRVMEHVEAISALNGDVLDIEVDIEDFFIFIQELKSDMIYDICDVKED